MSEEDRLRLLAEQTPSDPYAMAAYGRYLKHKKGDALNGNRWERRAVELLASRLSSPMHPMERYYSIEIMR